jgi:hypothetical protein
MKQYFRDRVNKPSSSVKLIKQSEGNQKQMKYVET